MDYKKAAEHWKKKDAESIKMDEEQLLHEVEEYIMSNNTCALATGEGNFIRCTPIEYSYHERAIWMFSEGGEKFIGLEKNKNVCIAIYNQYAGYGNLKGMQITGEADLIEPFTQEYVEAASYKKIPMEALRNLPEPMNLIKIVPKKIEFLNSDFKKEGFSSRQSIIL